MSWTVFNIIVLASPIALLWGWVRYLRLRQASDWRLRASVVGLAAPLVSVGLWVVMIVVARANEWHTSNSAVHPLITVGMWIPLVGMLVGFVGRPRLILAIVPASIGTVLFWFGTTLP